MANKAGTRRKIKNEYYFDYSLIFIVLFLLGFGLMMIYSASSYEAYADFGNEAYYLRKQFIAILVGLVAMVLVSVFPYTFWEKFAGFIYVVSLILVALVPKFGIESHGAKRWLPIPMFGSLQPAEVSKIAIIIVLASLISKMGKSVRNWKAIFMLLLLAGVKAIMVWQLTDNLSSGIIILGIGVLMIFVATPDYKKYVILAVGAIAAVSVGIYYIYTVGMQEGMNFRFKRILAWLEPEKYPTDVGYQTLQSLYAIGSGGIWGKGLGQSMQKLDFIPEAQNDMIFSIICEELGLFGAFVIMLLFIMLLWRMMIIANNANDLYGALLVVGVMGHIAIQVILNIGVVTNTIPNTGISLPFISYGGSSVLFLLAEIGLVISVASRIQLKES